MERYFEEIIIMDSVLGYKVDYITKVQIMNFKCNLIYNYSLLNPQILEYMEY